MKIAMTGTSGFVGSHLKKALLKEGHAVIPLVRREPKEGEVCWNPEKKEISLQSLEGLDGFIHLGGENIFGPWTKRKKDRIWKSRIESTAFLVESLGKLDQKPGFFFSASAIGFYGYEREEVVDETSPPGKGFLAELCQKWEEEARKANKWGIRTIQLRFGILLAKDGGALKKMVLPFSLGVGGPLGRGNHFMSWCSMVDVVSILLFLVDHSKAEGPFNIVSPNFVTNQEFSKALGKALHRPAFLPLPSLIPTLLFGREMVKETLFSSLKVFPKKLLDLGYAFIHPRLEDCFSSIFDEKKYEN